MEIKITFKCHFLRIRLVNSKNVVTWSIAEDVVKSVADEVYAVSTLRKGDLAKSTKTTNPYTL